jgi:WD40 repeat protein
LLRAGASPWAQIGDEVGTAFEPAARWLATAHLGSVAFWPLGRARSLLLSPEHGKIALVAFGPGGDWLASASDDGVIRMWPMSPCAGRATRDVLKTGWGFWAFALDYSGSTAMAVEQTDPALFVPLAGGEPRAFKVFSRDSAVWAAAFDQSGRYAAAAPGFSRDDMKIVVWDRANNTECEIPLREKNGADGYEGRVWSLAFGPDGALYSAGQGGVRRWDVATGLGEIVLAGGDALISLSRTGRVLAALISTGLLDQPDARSSCRVVVLDLFDGTKREILTHGSNPVVVAVDVTGDILVTQTPDGVTRVGPATGEEPHLLLADTKSLPYVDISPDGRWVAAVTAAGGVRLWPVPDVSKPPFHMLPYPELMAKLRDLTNLRVVEDTGSTTGYKLDVGPFPGWATVPEWQP